MASYLRPRRGKKATAVAQLTASAPLKRGEIFFEVPDTGVGTGTGKIKMGDGTTAYASLPYFMEQPTVDYTNAVVGWTNTTAADSSPYTTNATYVSNIIPSASLKTIFTNLKKLLLNYNSQLTTLNNDLGTLSFSQDEEGNWGYIPSGADTVIPFKSNKSILDLYCISESTGNATFDLSSLISNYESLTVDNFIFIINKASATAARNPGSTSASGASKSISPSLTYTASTGTLILSNCSKSYGASGDPYLKSISITGALYCIY